MDPNIPLSPRSPQSENAPPSSAKKKAPKKADLQITKTFQHSQSVTESENPKFLKQLAENGGGKKAALVGATAHKQLHGKAKELGKSQNPLELCSKGMQEAICQVEQSLNIATGGASMEERLEHMPEIPGSKGISGAYFAGPRGNRLLLIKPSIQELGMAGCTRDEHSHSASEPGKGAIRERMAYALQKEAGISFGIPESTVHFFSHEMLGIPSQVDIALNSLKAFDSISREDVVHLVNSSQEKNFCPAFAERLQAKLKQLVPDNELYDKITAFIDDPNNKNLASLSQSASFIEEMQTAFHGVMRYAPETLIKLVFGLIVIKHDPGLVEEAAMAVYNALLSASKPSEATFCSAQAVERECISFDSIAYNDDQTQMELVPRIEFEKVLFDVLAFSMDRHLANILARKCSVDQIKKNIVQARPEERIRLQAMLEHAKSKSSEYVYELILIDHGNCFPDPNYRISAIQPMMDWKHLTQANERVSPATKARILQLNPAAIALKLKEELRVFEEKYGESCQVSAETVQFQQVCSMVLQEAVRQDKKMNQIAAFFDEKFVSLYQVEVHGKRDVNWNAVQKKIKTSLASKGAK